MPQQWEAFKKGYAPERWCIREQEWDKTKQQQRETQFTQGNGYFCCRGILEEVPYDATPGTYLAGLFDRTGAQITELVNCPNPINMRIDTHGEKLDVVAMDVLKHERTLDMRDGVLNRQTIFKTTHKKRVLYQSRRFISMQNKHLGIVEIHLTPLDAAMTFNVQTTVDMSVSNKGVLTEGRKIHYVPHEVSTTDDLAYVCVRTFENQTLIAYATSLEICKGNRCSLVADRALRLRVRKGETITIRKFFTLYTSRRVKPHELKRQCIGALKKARRSGMKRLFEDHQRVWAKRWRRANVDIEGDYAADQALRFNLYHLIIAGNKRNDDVSVGARTLSGEAYRGHVFWDAELFITPFFMYAFPKMARNQLMYRYNRLNAARAIATAKGYKGALYPWESADTGEECTPSWAKDFDGTIIRITTLEYEHHIVADIAYAVDHYTRATGDFDFMCRYGLEMLIETARFWADRAKLNKKRKRYEIHDAMGPDEFHEKINNSAYTNMMAQWNLQAAASWRKKMHERYPKRLATLEKRLGLTAREIRLWHQVATKMYIPFSKKKNLIEQFDGYFKLRDPRITQLDANFMPCMPSSVDYRNIDETQLVKQADVVMLLHLFCHIFSHSEKKRNYYHYEKRTLHKSSLSPAIHSIVGLDVGDEDKALHYFAHSLATDLSDIHGNASEGIHAASAGGTWQAAIMGFAGMRIHADHISFTPHMPPTWRGLKFAVYFRGARLRVSMSHTKTDIMIERAPKRGKVFAEIYGMKKRLYTHRFVTFEAPANKKTR
jgi:kojibiose phosphorylase